MFKRRLTKHLQYYVASLCTSFSDTNISMNYLEQCFPTVFDSRHPVLAREHFCGTPGYNLPLNRRTVQKLAAPLELFTAPRLRAADLECVYEKTL